MKSRGLVAALVVLSLGVVAGAAAPAASAVDPIVIDLSFPPDCPDGERTVPAGVPVVVELGSYTTGTRGLTVDFLLKQQTMSGILRDGTLTTFDMTHGGRRRSRSASTAGTRFCRASSSECSNRVRASGSRHSPSSIGRFRSSSRRSG